MKARAVAKYIKGSPQKARLVIDLIRGRGVNEALAMLKTSNKRAAKPIEITLRSAIANASQKADQLNVAIDVDRLKISSATVDLGPTKYRRRVRPYGFRLGFNRTLQSNWIAKRDYADLLHEDLKLKKELKGRFAGAGVSHIDIERAANKLKIIIHTSRPGIIIGRKGAEIDKLKQEIKDRTGCEVYVNIQEIHKPELNAQLQAEQIAQQLEKRIAFRRAMRRAVENAQRFGAQGIKVRVSGRLNGAEIARSEWYLQGRLPLHTLRADVDYGFAQAYTTYGVIGVKCWIYKGEILPSKQPQGPAAARI